MATTKTRSARTSKVYQMLSVIGPSAGMDLRTSPTLLKPERARLLVNFSLTEPGALVVRGGHDQFSTTSLGAGRIQGAARVYLNTSVPNTASTVFSLVGFGGSVYVQSDSGGWSSAVLSGLSSSADLAFVHNRDLVVVFDGASTAARKSTNGSSWTRFGIAKGAAGPTLSALSTGGLSSGEWAVSFTYKDRDLAFESDGATESTLTLTGSTGAINVIVPNSTDAQVEAIIVYGRKVSAGETVLRKFSSQAQSGGASSTIVFNSSASLLSADEIPTTHGVPTTLSFGCVWKNRMWARDASVTNRLRFSEIFTPQGWPSNFYVDIPFERGDEIRALQPLGDWLLIFGNTRIFIIIGQSSLDFEVRPANSSEDGAFGFRSVCAIENGVVHAGANGIYIFDGATDRLLSFDIEPAWRDLVQNVSAAALARIGMVYHQQQKELRVAVPRRYPSGAAGEWVMDLNRTRTTQAPAWTATDRDIVGYTSWDGPETQAGDRGRLLSWPSGVGALFEEAVGTSANSSNMTAEYEGPGLNMGVYRARWIDMRGEYQPCAGNLSVEPVIDGVSMGSKSITMATAGVVYGTAVYGTAVYAGGATRRQFYRQLPLRAEGRTCVTKVVYVGQQAFKLFNYHVGLVPETAPRGFSE